MKPKTVENALEYVQEGLNILYQQQRNGNSPKTQVGIRKQLAVPIGSKPKHNNFNVPMHSLNQPAQ